MIYIYIYIHTNINIQIGLSIDIVIKSLLDCYWIAWIANHLLDLLPIGPIAPTLCSRLCVSDSVLIFQHPIVHGTPS